MAAASRRCTRRDEERDLVGVEAVIDKDLASSLLARELDADLFVMATDVDGVYTDWGTPTQARIERATPDELEAMDFPAGSMGPKVDAAVEFVAATGKRAAIGSLEQIDGSRRRHGGTNMPVRADERRRDERWRRSACTRRWASSARSSSTGPTSASSG